MTVTQFLGAFNDNLFKQLMLLLSLKVAAQDRQPVAMFVFSAPSCCSRDTPGTWPIATASGP